jgi:sporulation protein YabP
MNGQTEKQKHEIVLKNRRELTVQGVQEVDSFDENSAVLNTVVGELTVEGEELKIGTLDTEKGVVTVSGRINGVFYSADQPKEKRGIFKRIFD